MQQGMKKGPNLGRLEPDRIAAVVAGSAGLEPVASGVTAAERGLAGIGRTSQPPASAEVASGSG